MLRLADGREIDVDRIEHFAGLVVVTPCGPVGTPDPLPEPSAIEEVADEYYDVDPEQLRTLLDSHDASVEDMTAMCTFLTDQKVATLDELRGRLALLPEPPPKPVVIPPLPVCFMCGKPTPSRDKI